MKASWWLFMVGAMLLPGCADPPGQPTVTVTMRGLLMSPASAFTGTDQVSVTVYFGGTVVGDGGGMSMDASVSDAGTAGTTRRIVSWDGTDPFVFQVQLPATPIAGANAQATTLVGCDGGARAVLLASGSTASGLTPGTSGQDTVSLTMTAAPMGSLCP